MGWRSPRTLRSSMRYGRVRWSAPMTLRSGMSHTHTQGYDNHRPVSVSVLQHPQLPHGWDAGVLFEESQRTLFEAPASFHHGGDVEPLTSSSAAGTCASRPSPVIRGGHSLATCHIRRTRPAFLKAWHPCSPRPWPSCTVPASTVIAAKPSLGFVGNCEREY